MSLKTCPVRGSGLVAPSETFGYFGSGSSEVSDRPSFGATGPFFMDIFIVIIVDSHAVMRNNAERSLARLPSFPRW